MQTNAFGFGMISAFSRSDDFRMAYARAHVCARQAKNKPRSALKGRAGTKNEWRSTEGSTPNLVCTPCQECYFHAMKSTTFTTITETAEQLLTPEAVVLTIGSLTNRILDNSVAPMLLIVSQLDPPKILAHSVPPTDGMVVTATTWQGLLQTWADAHGQDIYIFTQGVSPDVVPFEG